MGFPQETEETLGRTARLMHDMECHQILCVIFSPHPETEAYLFCREKGLVGKEGSFFLHHHRSPLNCSSQNVSPPGSGACGENWRSGRTGRTGKSKEKGFSPPTFSGGSGKAASGKASGVSMSIIRGKRPLRRKKMFELSLFLLTFLLSSGKSHLCRGFEGKEKEGE